MGQRELEMYGKGWQQIRPLKDAWPPVGTPLLVWTEIDTLPGGETVGLGQHRIATLKWVKGKPVFVDLIDGRRLVHTCSGDSRVSHWMLPPNPPKEPTP